jgi:large subunit ribosomal protein L6
MSRIGKMPVVVPAGVEVKINGSNVKVKGPKGELSQTFAAAIGIALEDGEIKVSRSSDEREHLALHGTIRAIISNMVVGVSDGFTKILLVEGVGYRSEMNENNLVLHVGYSHPVEMKPPAGISFEVEDRGREIRVHGFDKQAVGQVAAVIRKTRPPEPYKGKGIRYQGEYIRRKAGKSAKTA